jgi:glycerol-3-phosphate dehydrogenase
LESDYDVVIIGAGILGAMIARELSKFEGRFALLEKESFPGLGVTRASLSQIHLPDFCPPGSLKGRLSFGAPDRFRRLSTELDVAYREVDQLWLALEPSHMENLRAAKARGESHGATGYEIIGAEKIRELEPHLTGKAVAALYARGVGVVYPPEWVFALMENAIQNGLLLYLNHPVTGISRRGSVLEIQSPGKRTISSKYIVNAAGLYSDQIAWMTGDDHVHLNLRKGTMLIFDKAASRLLRHMVYGTFSETHSQDIAPTAHGNLILGVHYAKTDMKEDSSVSKRAVFETMKLGKQLIPSLSEKDMITAFSGVLATNTVADNGDFYIAPSQKTPGVLHVIAGAPGLTAAPGIAEHVTGMLLSAGFKTEEKKDFRKKRTGWLRFESASHTQREKMIRANPKFGHIVCRCERVSEGEIVEAIRRGAHTMDAVKHLTRAGMGRCQGGFCGISVLRLLAAETHLSPTQITKRGEGSFMIRERLPERERFPRTERPERV